jgi:Fe-S cluster biogenesis protein NfuA
MKKNIKDEIIKALEEIRPHLQMDGGDVEFVEFDEKPGILKVKLQGACHSCPMAQITLQEGIGRVVKEKIPAVKEVLAV